MEAGCKVRRCAAACPEAQESQASARARVEGGLSDSNRKFTPFGELSDVPLFYSAESIGSCVRSPKTHSILVPTLILLELLHFFGVVNLVNAGERFEEHIASPMKLSANASLPTHIPGPDANTQSRMASTAPDWRASSQTATESRDWRDGGRHQIVCSFNPKYPYTDLSKSFLEWSHISLGMHIGSCN